MHDLAAPDEIQAGHLVFFLGDVLEIMECTFYNRAAFQRSIAALYERRRVAQQYGCFAEVGLYYEPGEKWKQHDELRYKFGSEIRCQPKNV